LGCYVELSSVRSMPDLKPFLDELNIALAPIADQFEGVYCMAGGVFDEDLVFVAKNHAISTSAFRSVLTIFADQGKSWGGYSPDFSYGSFRQKALIKKQASLESRPLHLLFYCNREDAELNEPPLLIKKIGLFSTALFDAGLLESWANMKLPELKSRLAFYRGLLCQLLPLTSSPLRKDSLLLIELRDKLSYIARHALEEVLFSEHGEPLNLLQSSSDVAKIAGQYMPEEFIENMFSENIPPDQLANRCDNLLAWLNTYE
jgi:hypothetical protein